MNWRRMALLGAAVTATLTTAMFGSGGAAGSTVSSASFSGGAGTTLVAGTLYAKQGGALTLTVNTSSDTKCVQITGAHTAKQTSSTAKSTWTFNFTASPGDGVQTVTAAASPNFNQNNGQCTGQSQSPQSASYVLDNTGPTVSGVLSPTPNAAGWNNTNVTVAWSATDAGSGVPAGGGPTPANDSVTASTSGVTKTSSATDRLGNSGSGSVTVRLDNGVPTITGSRSPSANSNGWNNGNVTVSFTCSDPLSGIKTCPGPSTLSSEGRNQSVTGQAVDNADNSATATVGSVNIDKTPPVLTGTATASPNSDGWYHDDVTIHWSCSDPALAGGDAGSGVGACPADQTITGEGTGLKTTSTVQDRAGNSTTANSAPGVAIDRTPPTTSASAVKAWNNVDVSVALSASDSLSGVKSTHYVIDGGSEQTGTSVQISDEGKHTLEFWSVDKAGNVETRHSVPVNIDKTPPTITHVLAPVANLNGWNNSDVTVKFDCQDALSGIASCTPDQVVTTEGAGQVVTGTAVDNAGNSAQDPAGVSLDKTDPTITAQTDRGPNANGWYGDDVTVSFTCGDALSGVDKCPSDQVLHEGANQSATGSAVDAAGNSKQGGVNGINVDKTAPMLTGTPTTDPNVNGWYAGDVVIGWNCSDALSGVDGSCPSDSTVTGEGANLSASESIKDNAGNRANTTVDGIKIDRTPPVTSIALPDPLVSGWYAGPVKIELKASDGLSGVDQTYYSVDGGSAQPYSGAFDFDSKGIHEITFWSTDKAGNLEDKTAPGHSVTVKIDGIPPTIEGTRLPVANAFGWNNTPVTVTFQCSDDESGIAGCTDPVTLSNEGADQSANGTALDNAGNTTDATVKDINIDLTAPSLSGATTTAPNSAGWYRDDVTVHWNASDALSGIDPDTVPADSVITGEGRNLGAGPVTVSDKAGNPSAAASLQGINIDRAGPDISGAAATSPNADGWYNKDVVVKFSCSDPKLADGSDGSGVATCPSDKVLSDDGSDQSVTSAPAADYAGNTTPGKTVGGINIDGHSPQTTANNLCTANNGWCTGATATVALTATDVGPSGVKEIHYSVNGGSEQVATGASVNVNVPLDGSGEATVSYYAVDRAGNAETPGKSALKYDNIAPMVTHSLNPLANAADWNNADTTVHFSAKDDDLGSGVDPSTVTPDSLVDQETAGKLVSGQAFDFAGNRGTDSVTVKLDKTAPLIGGATTTSPNANGWFSGPVTVHFTCGDALSGIASCPDDVTLTANGGAQSVTRTATDYAGNHQAGTVGGINIDSVAPSIHVDGVADGGSYTLGNVPAASCTATDALSGVNAGGCSVRVTGGLANGVGTFSYTATASDRAGNTASVSGTYRVIYRFDGFLQPINDTAHQVGLSTSIFKAGSTVPVKFQLKRADGSVVQANSPPVWQLPAKGSATTAPVDESAYSEAADGTSTFRWDSSGQQYIYNWGTGGQPKSYYYRVGVKLDDGQTYFVNIGLR